MKRANEMGAVYYKNIKKKKKKDNMRDFDWERYCERFRRAPVLVPPD